MRKQPKVCLSQIRKGKKYHPFSKEEDEPRDRGSSPRLSIFSAECTIGMVMGLTPLKHYGTMALWHYGTMEIRCKLYCLFN